MLSTPLHPNIIACVLILKFFGYIKTNPNPLIYIMKKYDLKHACSKCYPYLKKAVLGVLAVFVLLFVMSLGVGFYQKSQEINPIPVAL
ncbi:hypothetical protein B5J93_02145 [Moraxella equi]|uniref:Uncharacterized protein n=2 Tax=Moraxella equi TaxID=60442 RepID=A0ABX3NK51_9GAMM|nr:hypothetical protein B5J93_02145 [Moraxella equi]